MVKRYRTPFTSFSQLGKCRDPKCWSKLSWEAGPRCFPHLVLGASRVWPAWKACAFTGGQQAEPPDAGRVQG